MPGKDRKEETASDDFLPPFPGRGIQTFIIRSVSSIKLNFLSKQVTGDFFFLSIRQSKLSLRLSCSAEACESDWWGSYFVFLWFLFPFFSHEIIQTSAASVTCSRSVYTCCGRWLLRFQPSYGGSNTMRRVLHPSFEVSMHHLYGLMATPTLYFLRWW